MKYINGYEMKLKKTIPNMNFTRHAIENNHYNIMNGSS